MEFSFFLPYDLQDSPPAPVNSDVYISYTAEGLTVHVQSFGGYAGASDWIKFKDGLVAKLELEGKSYVSDYFYTAGYDSPFRFFNRHNEVWVVADTDSEK